MQRRVGWITVGCSMALASAWCQVSGAAGAAEGEDPAIALARDLELLVTETGPEQPWTVHLHNRGSTPIAVMADPGLLWFEVAVPGATSPRVCRLPEPLWPTGMRRRAELVLPPGERFSRRFDPRFFCFADLVQGTLVPGAKVTPRFGWPHELRNRSAQGKRQGEALTPRAPFVAWLAPPAPGEPAASDAEQGKAEQGETESEAARDEAGPEAAAPTASAESTLEGSDGAETPAPSTPWLPPAEGLKNLSGATLVLSAPYAKWSERPPAPSAGVNVSLLAGSDAEDERGTVITLAIGNGAAVPQAVVVRRELLSFDVLGPDGPFECPTSDLGAPDIAAFTTLQPGASEKLVVRLLEMCPRSGFSRPGVYEVRATFHGRSSGQELGLDAFVGEVQSPRPALVRVRSGERPSFLRAAPMVAGADGASGGAAAPAAPAEADAPQIEGPETPAEEPPADGAPAPEEAPAPDAPAPEGTSVE